MAYAVHAVNLYLRKGWQLCQMRLFVFLVAREVIALEEPLLASLINFRLVSFCQKETQIKFIWVFGLIEFYAVACEANLVEPSLPLEVDLRLEG